MSVERMKNIIVIGAHYDDPELGCGGSMAKFAMGGCNVYKLTLTDNETNFQKKGIRVEHLVSVQQSSQSCRILGVKEIDFDPLPCNYLIYNTEVMQRIESIVMDLNIDTAFIQYNSDMNQDHVEGSRLCYTALRHCRNILTYQSNGYISDRDFYPRYFVDISDTLELKKRALACYEGDHNRFGRLFEMSCMRNEIWGYSNEVKAAEGFQILRMMI